LLATRLRTLWRLHRCDDVWRRCGHVREGAMEPEADDCDYDGEAN
jgi:hypothetical protein